MATSGFGFNKRAVTVTGLTALAAQFRNADKYVESQARSATRKAGEAVQYWTEAFAARDTLFMSQNVEVRYSNRGLAFKGGWWAERFARFGLRFYPIYPELGTRFMAAQPALRPAYDIVMPDYQQSISAILSRSIKRMGNK